ncbi:MAG: N-acetylmuramoyl-L-alanine amidase [Bacteroidia bacterium]|nr:MAG: N-acetylmuramoyl-L-alanine amidase [Bacteroidia bacterium]
MALPINLSSQGSSAVKTVVIDPGHGGRDSGAVGRRAKEKDIALAISLKLGEYIREHIPDVEVIFTRETDVFVPLHERAQIANDNKADLFISIHCNSAANNAAIGTETFVMGLHRSQANLEVARRENKSILYEEDYLETYDGFDPHSPEANIIFSFYQNTYLEQSLQMASLVQEQFRERARRIDRGVKQAGFLVLYQIAMPGVLVEAGFLSNAREEQYLMSETGQAHIASAIFRAFRDYREAQNAYLLAGETYRYTNNNRQHYHADDEKPKPTEAAAAPGASDNQSQTAASIQNGTRINFRVQFMSTSRKADNNAPAFQGLVNVSHYFHEGMYKYTVGNVSSLEEASKIQKEMQEAGFHDAFVVAFIDDERISPSEAIRLLNKPSRD